jgi:hypothetical protein
VKCVCVCYTVLILKNSRTRLALSSSPTATNFSLTMRAFRSRSTLVLCMSTMITVLEDASAFSAEYPPKPKYQQLRFNSVGCKNTIASAATLRDLAVENAERTVGSLKYTKSWRHWSQLGMNIIRFHLSQNLPVEASEESELFFALGVAADTGEMPSFDCAGSRSSYAVGFFCRARLLADLLLDFNNNPTIPQSWKTDSKVPFSSPLHNPKTCRLLSIGGGPGYDYVAAALIASFQNQATDEPVNIQATIFDFEEKWCDLVDAMALATANAFPTESHTCHWGGKCDITKPLSHASNAACLPMIATTDLFVCQYCIAENAKALRESEFIFFLDLFRQAPSGAMFVFTETTPRVWPDFVDALASRPDFLQMEIGFPRNIGRGKSGPQLVLRKMAPQTNVASLLEEQEVELCDEFREKRAMHQRKMNSNWERQRRKIRGANGG